MLKVGGAGSIGERSHVIVFVIGGATFQEVREVTEVAKEMETPPLFGEERQKRVEQFLLGSTTVCTPDLMVDQIMPPL